MRKKLLALIAMTIALSATVAFAGCSGSSGGNSTGDSTNSESTIPDDSSSSDSEDDSSGGDSSTDVEKVLTIEETEIAIEKEENKQLTVTATGVENVVWESDNPSVAIVSNGAVTGISEGTATITVTAGDLTDSCIVNVTDPSLVPVIEFEDINIVLGQPQTIAPTVTYNGQDVEATIVYAFEDETVASEENGVLTALKVASTKLTIAATYNGKTAYASVTVTVVEDVRIDLSSTEVALTLVDNETAQVTATVLENNDAGTGATAWATANPAIAIVENGLITATGRGATEITFSYTTKGNITHEYTVNVTVSPKVVAKDEEIVFELTEEALTIELDEPAVAASIDGETLNATVNGNAITIASSEFGAVGKEAKITVSSAKVDYVYDAILANGIINSVEDYTAMWTVAEELLEGTNTFGGYWILGSDVNMKGVKTLSSWISNGYNVQNQTTGGFAGVFNGRGYTFMNVGQGQLVNSLFGVISGTVKNLGITIDAATQAVGWAPLAFSLSGTLENIYVSGQISSGQRNDVPQSALVWKIQSGAKMNNIYSNVKCSAWGQTAVVALGYMYTTEGFDVSGITNCFVVSPTNDMQAIFMRRGADGVAQAMPDTSWYATQNIGFYKGVSQAEAETAFVADTTTNTTSFNNVDCWLIKENGVPVFKNTFVFEFTDGISTLYNGNSATITVSNAAEITAEGLPEGVTFVDGVLTASKDLTTEAMVTIVATSIDFPEFKIEKTIQLKIAETSNELIDLGQVVKMSATTTEGVATYAGQAVTLDSSKLGEIKAVYLEDDTLISNGATIEYEKIAALSGNVKLKVEVVEGNKLYANVNVLFVDGIISTVEEYTAMWTAAEELADGTNTYGGYWKMGADIDVKNVTTLASWISNGYNVQSQATGGWVGTFDGCGYTFKNVGAVQLDNSLFGVISGTVKNLAITIDAAKQAAGWAPLAFALSGTLENIYVSGQVSSAANANVPQSGLVWRILSGAKMNNIYSNVKCSAWGQTTVVAFGYMNVKEGFDLSGITNCFVVSPTNDMQALFKNRGIDGAATALADTSWFATQNIGFYKGASQATADEAFVADTTTNTTSFEASEYWTVTDGVIAFKFASAS